MLRWKDIPLSLHAALLGGVTLFMLGISATSFLRAQLVTNFPDVNLQTYEGQAILGLAGYGIVNGYPTGLFGGGGLVNRAEAAKMLLRGGKISPNIFASNGRFPDVYD